MNLSKRITGLNGDGDDGWGVFYKARRLIAEGQNITELTIGEHDIRTDPSILAAMDRSARGGHTGYATVPGIDALRDTVAARVQAKTGVPTGRDNVLVTPGGQAALFAAHIAVCNPGDVALFCDPYYATYPSTLRAAGAEPRAIICTPEAAFQPSFEQIATKVRGASSLLVNTPNNPTGVVYSAETIEGIARACCEYDLWLISDEVYDTQIWEGEHISPRALPGMAERTLVIGSMSKSHAMTGSRVGWIVGPEEVIGHLLDLSTNTTYGVPGYIQDAAVFALDAGPELEEKVGAPFRRRRLMAREILAGTNQVGFVPSGGAMYIMLDVRKTGMSGEGFAESLLEQRQIAVMPGESFGAAAVGHVRVAMTVDDAAFAAALKTIIEFAEGLS